uniref:Small ribosomal subunit protein uS15c n=1 Tax=Coleochaete scutata TaxID=3125 RepID=A0A191T5Q9_COLSC|nr:ribosomal protein S15 [Coleochaete scutata]ANI25712.1 ribosomal protein S15 [Coleochaete scutata]
MFNKQFLFTISELKQGSAESQISNLTDRIRELTDHLKIHKKDYSSQRGLLKILGKRKRLLSYLAIKDIIMYKKLISKLGIRSLKGYLK